MARSQRASWAGSSMRGSPSSASNASSQLRPAHAEAAAARARGVPRDAVGDDGPERLQGNGPLAVVVRLGDRVPAAVRSGQARVLRDVRGEIPERPLDGLGLPGVGLRPVDVLRADQLGQQARRVLVEHLAAVAVRGAAGEAFGGDAAAVVDDHRARGAVSPEHVGGAEPVEVGGLRGADAPAEGAGRADVLPGHHDRAGDGAVRPLDGDVPAVPVGADDLHRGQRLAVADLGRPHAVQRLGAPAGEGHGLRGDLAPEPAGVVFRVARAVPAPRLREPQDDPDGLLGRRPLGSQVIGLPGAPRLRVAAAWRAAAGRLPGITDISQRRFNGR